MKQLRETFIKNELPYTLIKRNDEVAMYGVGGTYTKEILHHEVCRIQQIPTREIFGHMVSEHESLPSNEQFGREGSRAIVKHEDALKYFNKLTEQIIASKEHLNMP